MVGDEYVAALYWKRNTSTQFDTILTHSYLDGGNLKFYKHGLLVYQNYEPNSN